jgi:hypothetical protein
MYKYPNMSLESRLQRLYEWTPSFRLVYKKPVPTGLKTVRVPQTTGAPGWIILTYQNNIPVCYWLTTHESKQLPCIADERICGDTIIRAEQLNDSTFVLSDIWMYNSNCVYACSTFSQRYAWLQTLMKTCIRSTSTTPTFLHKSELSEQSIRGYEEHPVDIGKHGYFIEKDTSEVLTITKLSIPDCYDVAGKGYLRVPNLKTSVYLRLKGDTFRCRCVPYDDDYWDVQENIPEIDVNAP